ncbi:MULTISPECIES: PepSY-associated TM helix domain-containing protein [unclassified Arcicella]|uniref:PepSY-associated TM helix domain-containing protein n=1 Tax=unclassified Arcicella TaxID=2644986 RepID=UPI002864B35E|nr:MULTISPECIES: PepSY-associated TM helix domain-containing protein [unclassified Arcicella]MDR6564543.1 putative iron-regulated membrane protein [Arcicella sp. BE51]MDR6825747.1 putative iron-regulated membrane protein [Arcicella sp. BE139]
MKSFKKIIGKIHLWLGLASGLVVFIVSITGCLYAFQEEIQNVTQPFRFVEPQNKPFLRPSALEKIALKALPNKQLHAILYSGKSQSAQAIFYHYEPSYYYITYLNPYNGEVLEVKDMDSDFFRIVLMGHYYLWLPPTIGQPIVATSTLVFVVMLISGIILWWPKNESAAKQRFWFRWKNTTKWKRKNYDLHNILGFYSAWIVLIIALTGLVWGFEWFANSVYGGLGGEKSTMYTEVFSDKKQKENLTKQSPAIDRIWYKMLAEQPLAKTIEVHIPESDSASLAVNINVEEGTTWKIDYRYFDQYSLKELSVNHLYGRFPVDKVADKILRMNYDIHVGAIFGLAGKVLAFLVSLVAASLPISGVLIWWGRRKKQTTATASSKEYS